MNNKGLTLIECLIAILLLTILLTGGMAFYFYAHQSLRWATHKRIAVEIANSKMEDIKNDTSNYLLHHPADPNNGWLCEKIPNLAIGSLVNANNTLEVYAYNITGASYKQFEVRVNWQQPGKTAPETISLDTYIAP